MKLILAIIGLAVVLVVLVAAVLYFLSIKEIIKGPLADWITNVMHKIFGIKDDTEKLWDEMTDGKTGDLQITLYGTAVM
jgi:hypothetical protein